MTWEIDSGDLLEAISGDRANKASKFVKRHLVYIISPDPFISNDRPMQCLKYGSKAAFDSGRRNESPLLCYAFKLGLYGFNQWTVTTGPFSKQQLFDIQVSQMLRCKYVAVYGDTYTESMQLLLDVAKLNIPRIDFRTV